MALNFKGDRVVAELRIRADRSARAVAERVLQRAKANCPVDTGDLRASGHTQSADQGTVHVRFTKNYAIPVHFGNGRNTPNPFLDRALLEEFNAARETFTAIVRP